MADLLRLRVDGTKLTVERLPSGGGDAEPTERDGKLACAVAFDEGWDGLSRTLLLRRRGEAPMAMQLRPLRGGDGRLSGCLLPPPFGGDDRPLLLSVEGAGRNGNGFTCRLRTNDVCAALRSNFCGENRVNCYEGPFTLRKNGVYPFADTFVPQDLTVAVPEIDLTGDTVTPDALLAGVTAHDAAGNRITGTARGLSVACGERPPRETDLLWVRTTVSPERITADCVTPAWRRLPIGRAEAGTRLLRWTADGSGGLFACGLQREGGSWALRLLHFAPDGRVERASAGKRSFPSPDALRVLDLCAGAKCVYLLFAADRAVSLYRFDCGSGDGQLCGELGVEARAVLSGGVAVASEPGASEELLLYTNSADAKGELSELRVFRADWRGLSPVAAGAFVGGGDGGLAVAQKGVAYTGVRAADGSAVTFDLRSETFGVWRPDVAEALRVEGALDGFVCLRDPCGLQIYDPRAAECARVRLRGAGRRICAWTAGEDVFLVGAAHGALSCASLPRGRGECAVYLSLGVSSDGESVGGARLPLFRAGKQSLFAEVSGAFSTDGKAWRPVGVYRHDGTLWKRVSLG